MTIAGLTSKSLQVGERVNCEAIVNTGGGNYNFRCTRVQVAQSTVSLECN